MVLRDRGLGVELNRAREAEDPGFLVFFAGLVVAGTDCGLGFVGVGALAAPGVEFAGEVRLVPVSCRREGWGEVFHGWCLVRGVWWVWLRTFVGRRFAAILSLSWWVAEEKDCGRGNDSHVICCMFAELVMHAPCVCSALSLSMVDCSIVVSA